MKLWLCGITSAGNEANLRALIDPILPYFSGIQMVFHHPIDGGAEYLETNKKEGRIIYVHFSQRHGASMTQFLHQGTMEGGDFFVTVDSMERLGVEFCRDRLPQLIHQMSVQNIAMIANYGKGLIFRYSEQLEFKGSPHWFGSGFDGSVTNIELPSSDFWNVRSEQREPFQFVTHYLKYYLYPAGSNHCLLGLEKNGDPKILFPIREARRLNFRKALTARRYSCTVDGVKSLMNEPLDEEMKEFFSNEKILNDSYRYFHLGRTDFVDNHNFADIIPIL